jgi:ribonuclease P protein component
MLNTIKKRSDFLAVTAHGKRFITPCFILQMHKRAESHPAGQAARVGFTVTKKLGNAVVRNRIRRRLREAVRAGAIAKALPGCDYVMIPRHKALDCDFASLVRDMEFAFSRIPYMKDDTQKPKKNRP